MFTNLFYQINASLVLIVSLLLVTAKTPHRGCMDHVIVNMAYHVHFKAFFSSRYYIVSSVSDHRPITFVFNASTSVRDALEKGML
jgi:hypothetical protein